MASRLIGGLCQRIAQGFDLALVSCVGKEIWLDGAARWKLAHLHSFFCQPLGDHVENIAQIHGIGSWRCGLQRRMAALRAGMKIVIAQGQSIAAGPDGFAPAAGRTLVMAGGRRNGHGRQEWNRSDGDERLLKEINPADDGAQRR